jgi:hypothetical protein
MDDPQTSALLRSLVSATPNPILDPGPSHFPEPEPQPTEPPAETESEPAAPERYISSQDQSTPLQPLSVAQQSATAGDDDDDKPALLYPLFYRGFRGVGVRRGGRRNCGRAGRVAKPASPRRRRHPRTLPPNQSTHQATRSLFR